MLYDVDVAVTLRAVLAVQQKADQSSGVCYADISLLVDILQSLLGTHPPSLMSVHTLELIFSF